ncbi:hypothetical protein M3Y99_00840300 [Aphelenchoides fujianensis]|nr:hypothetical protein M3Y99_00840300 [Aphelenchoides fujianensis]
MFRSLALLCLVAVAVNADGLLSFVPHNHQARLSPSARQDLASLQMKDLKALQQVAHHAPQFTSFAQVQHAVKQASPQAYALATKRAQQAKQAFNGLKAQLSPKSQQFFSELSHLAVNFAHQAKNLLAKQDGQTKQNLAHVFPHVQTALNTPAGHAFVQHYAKH